MEDLVKQAKAEGKMQLDETNIIDADTKKELEQAN